MKTIEDLLMFLRLWKAGEDCLFACSEILMELGLDHVAAQHCGIVPICVPEMCSLVTAYMSSRGCLLESNDPEKWLQAEEEDIIRRHNRLYIFGVNYEIQASLLHDPTSKST